MLSWKNEAQTFNNSQNSHKMDVRNLEPKHLWNHFADINAVPRPSKKEELIRKFIFDFGVSCGLETQEDKIGNIIIKKPASSGMESRQTVILQSHLDMVHQKNASTHFDFNSQGIEMIVDEDWVRANGTTLGADNGIGVAAIMAVLASNDIVHPALEALFTIDEETGMTGAKELDGSLLNGTILLNLDTEDDDELSIGCAGGIDTNTDYSYNLVPLNSGSKQIEIQINGLLGGHSGMDIDKGRGNANKLMSRFLLRITKEISIQLIDFDGGSLRNAIPREAISIIAISDNDLQQFTAIYAQFSDEINAEFASIEPNLNFVFKEVSSTEMAMSHENMMQCLHVLCAVHNGVYRMSPDISDLVEASSSLARVVISKGTFSTQSLQRSSVESTKEEIASTIRACFELIGAKVIQGGDYPGWKPNPDSQILGLMEKLYKDTFNEKANVKACHAGLECGILGKHLPGVDMISFGPNIRAAHSPDEKVQISSVQKFWGFYLKTLQQIPNK